MTFIKWKRKIVLETEKVYTHPNHSTVNNFEKKSYFWIWQKLHTENFERGWKPKNTLNWENWKLRTNEKKLKKKLKNWQVEKSKLKKKIKLRIDELKKLQTIVSNENLKKRKLQFKKSRKVVCQDVPTTFTSTQETQLFSLFSKEKSLINNFWKNGVECINVWKIVNYS